MCGGTDFVMEWSRLSGLDFEVGGGRDGRWREGGGSSYPQGMVGFVTALEGED